jgi:TFIIF-interacting CTD phosphatase-like protein
MSVSTIYHVAADDIPSASITDKCIVLDLDLTLVSTQDNISSLKEMGILSDPKLISLRNRTYYITIEDLEAPGIGTRYDFWGVVRPHTHEFLMFCFSYFKIVAVWSAGKRPYVEAIVDHLFRDLPQPHIIFSHDDIESGPNKHVLKPLTKMIASNPIMKRNMSLQNTLAIDDNSMTYYANPGNGVLIPAYEPALNVNAMARDDPSLLQLKYWLLQPEVAKSKDVTTLDKKKIFSTSLETYKASLKSIPGYRFS